MTLFVVGFICGGVCIGTLVAAIMLSMGSSTDAEARAYDDLHGWMHSDVASVRADLDNMPTSEDISSGEVV